VVVAGLQTIIFLAAEMDNEAAESEKVIRPPSIWLTQVWLAFNAIPILTGGVWACFSIAYRFITHLSALHLSDVRLLPLLKFIGMVGIGILTAITFWALQKRARVGRWLALVFIGVATAKTAYHLLKEDVLARDQSDSLILIDRVFMISVFLFQLAMLYRFAFGRREKAFLSK
jgi:hypothetical protein